MSTNEKHLSLIQRSDSPTAAGISNRCAMATTDNELKIRRTIPIIYNNSAKFIFGMGTCRLAPLAHKNRLQINALMRFFR